MVAADRAAVAAIERDSPNPLPSAGEAVFADRLAAFPERCLVAGPERAVAGCAIAPPGRLGTVPALGPAHIDIPQAPDCLRLHDVALRPARRGRGPVPALLARLDALARAQRMLALTAVHGAETLRSRHGFAAASGDNATLAAYGATARVMTRAVR